MKKTLNLKYYRQKSENKKKLNQFSNDGRIETILKILREQKVIIFFESNWKRLILEGKRLGQ